MLMINSNKESLHTKSLSQNHPHGNEDLVFHTSFSVCSLATAVDFFLTFLKHTNVQKDYLTGSKIDIHFVSKRFTVVL